MAWVVPTMYRDLSKIIPRTLPDHAPFRMVKSAAYAQRMELIHSEESRQVLRATVQVKSLNTNIISVSAQGRTAAQAERTADAVASSYVAYVNSPSEPGTPVHARVLQPALNATETPPSYRLLVTGGLGALLGALIASIGVIVLGRGHRPFRMK
jgi:capsular polysaccharide biosynthesis protein